MGVLRVQALAEPERALQISLQSGAVFSQGEPAGAAIGAR